jgi:hypothetical protein
VTPKALILFYGYNLYIPGVPEKVTFSKANFKIKTKKGKDVTSKNYKNDLRETKCVTRSLSLLTCLKYTTSSPC